MKSIFLVIFIIPLLLISSCNKTDIKEEVPHIPNIKVVHTLTPDSNQHPLGILEGSKNGVTLIFRIAEGFIDVRTRKDIDSKDVDILELYREMLLELVKLFDINKFTRFQTGSFSRCGDPNWSIPIAVASSKSHLYKDYRENYPNSQLKYLNNHFVYIANELYAYRELDTLFKEFGINIKLTRVEKVFTGKVSEIKLREQLVDAGLSLDTRVMFDSGIYTFSMTSATE